MLAEQLARDGNRIAAVRQLAAAARDGLPEAQSKLGLCYLNGEGVPANQAEARHWLERAASGGNVTAQTELASLALRGVTGPYRRGAFPPPLATCPAKPDLQAAANFAREAAHAGSAEAMALLAFILGLEPLIAESPGEADALYKESAQTGWPPGQLGYAMTLLREQAPGAISEAHHLLTAAAEAGLPTAHFLLGAMAEAGTGQEQDLTAALDHYRIAAERGHISSKTRLGLALLYGRGARRDTHEAETWLRRAARDNDATAAAALGDFYANAVGQPKNMLEAARWYRHAAELGHPGSARALAHVIFAGVEGKPDPSEIAGWLETAIEGGESTAWQDLGGLIASSILPRDQLPALHGWLQRMIQQHRPEAGYFVGICVNSGIGTPVDATLARRYYLWAAGEGLVEAMVAAAEMLLNGRGGNADPDLARALFHYAAKRNHAGAVFALGVMASNDRASAIEHFRRAAALGHTKAKLLTDADSVPV